ncbi:hypothetical protein Trydic_g13908 [Trypoxylus dichotomus]
MLTMRSVLVLILILGYIALCEVHAYPQGASKCYTPGESFYDGCNTCGCSEEGYITFSLSVPLSEPQVPKEKCDTPGKPFFDGCNTCGCSEEGLIIWCTFKYCGPVPTNDAPPPDDSA